MNKIYRTIWSDTLNCWVVASEYASSRKIKNSTAQMVLGTLVSVLMINNAHAVDECGPAVSGDSITCTGLVSGDVTYLDKNINLIVDGVTNGAANLTQIRLDNSNWMAPPDNYDLSLTTNGPVSIMGTNNELITLSRSRGGGDVNLTLGSNTSILQTAADHYNNAIMVQNYESNSSEGARDTNIVIHEGVQISTNNQNSATGIRAYHYGQGKLNFINHGTLDIVATGNGNFIEVTGVHISANTQNITIENHGTITLKNSGSTPIIAQGMDINLAPYFYDQPFNVTMTNTGNIQGDYRYPDDEYYGAFTYFDSSQESSNFVFVNSGTISNVNYGIYANVNGGNAYWSNPDTVVTGLVKQSGTISAENIGIWMSGYAAEELTVQTSGKITTGQQDDTKGVYITSSSGGLIGLGLARVIQESGGEIYDQGTGNATAAIAVDHAETVDISVSGKVRSHKGSGILLEEMPREYIALGPSGAPPFVLGNGKSTFKVELKAGATVTGGFSSAGILTKGGNDLNVTVNEGALLESLSDIAIKTDEAITEEFSYWDQDSQGNWNIVTLPSQTVSAAPVTLKNAGTITGTLLFGNQNDNVTIESSGVWNIRHFSDTDGDGIRDTKSVAVSDFGGGEDLLINHGIIRLDTISAANHVDPTGEYLPLGTSSIINDNVVQGQLLNLKRFENAGTIDLTANQRAGDVLVISGGNKPGQNGQGVFVANGGYIKLDTVLNEGGANSQSDVLVVDNVLTGINGGTNLLINQVGGMGALTTGYGIKVVDVLGSSTPDAFKLANAVVAGAYEYVLVNAIDNSWYLSSRMPDNILPGLFGMPIYRPDVGINFGNQTSIVEFMVPGLNDIAPNGISGSGIMRSDLRLSNTKENQQYSSENNTVDAIRTSAQKSNTVWAFTTGTKTKYTALGGQIAHDAKSYGIQIGGDHSFDIGAKGLLIAGFMANMNQANTKSINRYTGTRAKGSLDGYGVGAYATYFFDKENLFSPFIDTYMIYGRYNNEISTTNNPASKYNTNAWSFTVQGGYPIVLTPNIAIEPQAQLTYVNDHSGSYYDHNRTHVTQKLKNNVIGRIGAYVYGHGYQVKPYGVLNLWYDSTQSDVSYQYTDFNNGRQQMNTTRTTLSSDKKGFIVEAKVGFQTQTSKNFTLWGELAYRKGQHSFKDFGGSVGIKYMW